MTTAEQATAAPRPDAMPPAPPDWPDPADPGKLPAGFDDERSAYYLAPELRDHFSWTADDERDLQRNLPKHGVPVTVPAPADHVRRGGNRWAAIAASPDNPAGLSLIRFQKAEHRARFNLEQAARSASGAELLDRRDTCEICSQVVRPIGLGGPGEIHGTRRRVVKIPTGQRGVRCCGSCVLTIETITAERAAAEIIADDGSTRLDAAHRWLESIEVDR